MVGKPSTIVDIIRQSLLSSAKVVLDVGETKIYFI